MAEHPIEGLMKTAMNSIKDMIDVNTIIGKPIQAGNQTIIIPISKVSFGFAAGGSEFKGETINEYTKKDKEEAIQYRLPFGGGSGAGVNITAVAFLVVQDGSVKLMSVDHPNCVDKLLEYVPDLAEKAEMMVEKICLAGKAKNKEKKEKTEEKCKVNVTQNYVDEYIDICEDSHKKEQVRSTKQSPIVSKKQMPTEQETNQEQSQEEIEKENDGEDIKVEFYNQIIPPQSDGESFEDD